MSSCVLNAPNFPQIGIQIISFVFAWLVFRNVQFYQRYLYTRYGWYSRNIASWYLMIFWFFTLHSKLYHSTSCTFFFLIEGWLGCSFKALMFLKKSNYGSIIYVTGTLYSRFQLKDRYLRFSRYKKDVFHPASYLLLCNYWWYSRKLCIMILSHIVSPSLVIIVVFMSVPIVYVHCERNMSQVAICRLPHSSNYFSKPVFTDGVLNF